MAGPLPAAADVAADCAPIAEVRAARRCGAGHMYWAEARRCRCAKPHLHAAALWHSLCACNGV